jgi:hypothetical protein
VKYFIYPKGMKLKEAYLLAERHLTPDNVVYVPSKHAVVIYPREANPAYQWKQWKHETKLGCVEENGRLRIVPTRAY